MLMLEHDFSRILMDPHFLKISGADKPKPADMGQTKIVIEQPNEKRNKWNNPEELVASGKLTVRPWQSSGLED